MRCLVHCRQNTMISREVGCSPECYEHRPCGLIGLPATTSTLRFLARPGGSTSCVVPRLLTKTGSSSRELGLLFRVSTASNLPPARMRVAPSLGFPSPSRHQLRRSTCERGSQPTLRSAPGVSHALDGLLSPRPCGLVSSHCHVRDSPFRGLFPPPSRTVSSTARALLSLTTVSCRLVSAAAPELVTSPSGL
jgi:hypothetical protein